MKKRGFTLVELLAVIAILAILVIMALPAVLRMFNNARKDSFTNEVNVIIRTARQKYLLSSGSETIWTNAEGHANTLDLTGNSKLTYYVQMNNEGKIIKLQVSNGDFQYNKTDNNGIDVASSNDVEEVTDNNELVIDGNGNLPPTAITCFNYIKACDSVTYDINQETCRNYLINECGYSNEGAAAYCDKDSGYGRTIVDALLEGSIDESEYANYGLSNVNGTCPSITITGYDETCGTDVVIPSRIDNTPVTIIDDGSFSYKGITSVILPNTLTEIRGTRDEGAFEGNLLTSIVIPNSVTTIGGYVFSENAISSLSIPSNVISIGVRAFAGNQLTSLVIPDNVQAIYQSAFISNKISSLTIGTGLTMLGNYAFANNNLTSLTIPGNITTIGDYAFDDNNLITLNLLAGVNMIGKYAFSNNRLTSVTIPSSVGTIKDLAFSGNNIDTVTISYAPGYETIVSDLLQGGNYKLYFSTLIIENGIKSIYDNAFRNNHITSVTFPSSITYIGEYSFSGNPLTSVTIPSGIIDRGAFSSTQLTTLTLGENVTKICDYAFSGNLLTSVIIPNSVTTLGKEAFNYNQLTTATIKEKTSSSDFTTYGLNPWGWASDVTCVKNNTSNVENGCITWGA